MNFSKQIVAWYQLNKRDLPWRNTTDPFLIWMSEVILQQTKVEQGLSYFIKFKEKYPSVKELARADEEEVLKLWQGLGYYSRARNLHQTAKTIVDEFNGTFPKNYTDILKLRGVGEYTASAILSFAFNKPFAVVDGNVYRVLSRVFGVREAIDTGLGQKIFKKLAFELLDKRRPSIYNQAIMEFGALQCTPKNLKCELCPFAYNCYAKENGIIEKLPFKSKKIKIKDRFFNYLVINDEDNIYLKKRIENDIWKGLYDFPLIETKHKVDFNDLINNIDKHVFFNKSNVTLNRQSQEYKHILTHQNIFATFWHISVKDRGKYFSDFVTTNLKEINKFAVPKLIENYIKFI